MKIAVLSTMRMALWVMFIAVMNAGCASHPDRKVSNGPVSIKSDFDTVWQEARGELKRRGFELDVVDRRTGVIETLPMTSAQWFEPWREDVVDDKDRLESSLQTVRRRVCLDVTPLKQGQVEVACHVTVERQVAQKDRVITSGSVRAAEAFPGSSGRIPDLKDKYRQNDQIDWAVLGNDPALEQSILKRISKSVQ